MNPCFTTLERSWSALSLGSFSHKTGCFDFTVSVLPRLNNLVGLADTELITLMGFQ